MEDNTASSKNKPDCIENTKGIIFKSHMCPHCDCKTANTLNSEIILMQCIKVEDSISVNIAIKEYLKLEDT